MPNQRCWCFTAWSFPDFELKAERNFTLRYVVFGLEECPKTGEFHFQGYCEFSDKVSMATVKKVFNDNTMHLEPRYGTQAQAIEYCCKDGQVHEWGTPQFSGKRNDIADIITECKTVNEVMDKYPSVYCAYRNGLRDIYTRRFMEDIPDWRAVEVRVYYGSTGSGKTRKAVTEAKSHGTYYKLTCHDNNSLWFDGYTGQTSLIIDEFYGWIKWNFLLTLLDGYNQCRLPIKGGFTFASWTHVYITSNVHPMYWYKSIRDMSPLMRRITSIERMGVIEDSHDEVLIGDGFYFNDVPNTYKINIE